MFQIEARFASDHRFSCADCDDLLRPGEGVEHLGTGTPEWCCLACVERRHAHWGEPPRRGDRGNPFRIHNGWRGILG